MEDHAPLKKEPEAKGGYLVLRLRLGEGFVVADLVEVRVASPKGSGDVHLAIRAPKEMKIRRLK